MVRLHSDKPTLYMVAFVIYIETVRYVLMSECSVLIGQLEKSPFDFRHLLAILDPVTALFDPGGYEIIAVGKVPLLVIGLGVVYVWSSFSDESAHLVAGYVDTTRPNELFVIGNEPFGVLRPVLNDGQWRMSRNYGVKPGELKTKHSSSVRLLTPDDRELLRQSSACIQEHVSTWRDFDWMVEGNPLTCFGAIVDGCIVGFCSANPLCRGVQEISWIVVNPEHRRHGFASAMLSAQIELAFKEGKSVAYHAGSAGEDLNAMLGSLGFTEVSPTYRFIPSDSPEQWRTMWGRVV